MKQRCDIYFSGKADFLTSYIDNSINILPWEANNEAITFIIYFSFNFKLLRMG